MMVNGMPSGIVKGSFFSLCGFYSGNCEMARPKRFELLTPRFVVWCSIQLSYGRVRGGGRRKAAR